MKVHLHIIEVRGKGVEVATPASTTEHFWLPRAAVRWAEIPEPGIMVGADVPRWLTLKCHPLRVLRNQYALPLVPEPGLDPEKAKGPFPMSDYPQDAGRGFISRNKEKTKPSQPDFKGSAEINGVRFWVSGWTAENEKGKFLKLSFRRADENADDRRQQPMDRQQPDQRGEIPF